MDHQPNDPGTGLEFYDLSATFGHNAPLWPYFEDVKIERMHYHAKSGVLSQKITTVMHCTTHTDAPAHVIEGAEYTDQVPLYKYFGPAVVLSAPKTENWAPITREDLEKATPEIQPGDLVIINCGWHKYYGDSQKYFAYSPGLVPSAVEYLLEKGAKGVGVDQQALDHPLATAIGRHGPGPLLPGVVKEYEQLKGHPIQDDFPDWEPCHRLILGNGMVGFENVCGADIDKVSGKRVTIAAFPWRWEKGDGCIVRIVAIVDPTGEFRLATGKEG